MKIVVQRVQEKTASEDYAEFEELRSSIEELDDLEPAPSDGPTYAELLRFITRKSSTAA